MQRAKCSKSGIFKGLLDIRSPLIHFQASCNRMRGSPFARALPIIPASIQITLNDQPYASGTPVTTDGYYTLFVTAANTFGTVAQAAVFFAVDKTAPQITVTSPADNGTVNASLVTLTGYVMDAHPETLTVNGSTIGSPGQSSFSTPVGLTDGANTIALSATNSAGNSGSLTWHVTLKTSAPTVCITSPQAGFVNRNASVAVSGMVSSDAVSVTVNDSPTAILSGAFTVSQVALNEGSNTITTVARNAAGNQGTATLQVTRSSTGPFIQISAPSEGSHTSADSAAVTGTLNGSPSFGARVHGTVRGHRAPCPITQKQRPQPLCQMFRLEGSTTTLEDSGIRPFQKEGLSPVGEYGNWVPAGSCPPGG